MTEAGLEALVIAVNQSIADLDEELTDVRSALVDTNRQLEELPKKFIPRTEAARKAEVVKNWFAGVIVAGVIVALTAFGFHIDNQRDSARLLNNCRENRQTMRDVIQIAVPEREPATPGETPLRDRLLTLEGTHPERC